MLLIHLTPAANLASIRRSGIRARTRKLGIYAMPVLANFLVTHQWLRELKRTGARTFGAVYFRIPDDEHVLVGRYNEPAVCVPAARASAIIACSREPLGMQIIVPRAVRQSELHRMHVLPAALGWRYHPLSHGQYGGLEPLIRSGTIRARRRKEFFARKQSTKPVEGSDWPCD